jgi:hypothetical protein
VVIDPNIFTTCKHPKGDDEVNKTLSKLARASLRLLETPKPRGKAHLELYIPKKWREEWHNLIKDAHRQRIEGIDRDLLASMIDQFRSVKSVTSDCEDVRGYCEDDYKYVCSAISKFRSDQLWVITCLDKTLSEDKLRGLLKEQLGGRCMYNLVENVAGDTGIYIVYCNIDERLVSDLEGLVKSFLKTRHNRLSSQCANSPFLATLFKSV